ncbi:cation diffusion facilitator family transporter [Borrelia miyamotoi]|uniref:cation diffusion facilitator family transporter n=1 Tax=Borrelia miyamotoi TaxID=47466 RepID=UPI001C785E01|nr:cation transporter [Borrelia miyamotoi]BCR21210.1 Zinc transporter ZitB [Borrelia miyamotoi]
MIKVINYKNINKCSHLKLESLKKDEIYIAYIENNMKIISYLKAQIKNKESKINHFYIDPNFKAEGIEKVLINNLIYYGKKNKLKKILCEIKDINEELKSLEFSNENNIYEKDLTYETKKNTIIMKIGLSSVLAEIASITSKLTVGILFNSFALIADALHVISDLILSTITYFSLKITSRPETIYYPYGYKKMENLISFIIGIIIIITGFTIFLNTAGLNKLINLSSKSELLHIHHHNYDHHSQEDKKNILEIFSNNSLKKSIWIPLVPFIFFLVKIIEYLAKFQIGKRYNNYLLLALSSSDKNCIFSHGGTTLSLLLANYIWTGFDKVISICISFIMLKEGLQVIINNANNLLSKQDIDLKREVKNTLKNIDANLKELNFLHQGNTLILYIKLDLNYEKNLKSLMQKIENIKKIIKTHHKEICEIYVLI